MFEHFGMVCSHALKGDDPSWAPAGSSKTRAETLDKGRQRYSASRVFVLPEGPRFSQVLFTETNNLHLSCLQNVKLGDNNVDAYSLALEQLRNVKTLLEPVAAILTAWGYLIEKRQLILQAQRYEIHSILVQ